MPRAFFVMVLVGLSCATPTENDTNGHELRESPPCHIGGCSGQVCTDRDDVATTCEWLPEYACYKTARCEPQSDGACGWTRTPELVACIDAARRQ